MAYFAPYIDETGLHIPSYTDIRDDLIEEFKQIYGTDIYLENDSQDYQMISAFALHNSDVMQLLQIVYNNHGVKTAIGTGLDSLVKLNGIRRKRASYSTCVLTLSVDRYTVISAGVCEDSSGNRWILPENIFSDKEKTVRVTARCETIGAIEALPNTITKISTPQKGWFSVTNEVAAVVGNPIETDSQLKERQTLSVAMPSRNMTDGVRAGILAIDSVTKCKLYDNDTNITDKNGIPGHTISVIVEGGMDADIAEQIFLRKGPGCGTYGDVVTEYKSTDGQTQIVRFFRPVYVAIDVNISVKKLNSLYDLTNIENTIKNYFLNLEIGSNVTLTGIFAAVLKLITDEKNPFFSINTLAVRKTGSVFVFSDIEIKFKELAVAGTITVEGSD